MPNSKDALTGIPAPQQGGGVLGSVEVGRSLSLTGDLNLNSIVLLDSDGDTPSTWTGAGDDFVIATTADAASLNAGLVDTTSTSGVASARGIVSQGYTGSFLAIADTQNGDNTVSGEVTAAFSFDISTVTGDLSVCMDWAAFGDFETSNDFFTVTASIDGGAAQTLFTLAPDEAGSLLYTFDDGSTQTLNDPMQITDANGTVNLTNAFQTFTNDVVGTGSTLVITITGQADGGNDILAMSNLVVNGRTSALLENIEAGALTFEEHDGAQTITSTITITDNDDTQMEGAEISITGGFDAANDTLAFTDANGITGTYDAATGILSLVGTASIANYEAALRSVTYDNAFTTESTATRTFSFTVDDGDLDSNAVSRDFEMQIDETFNGTAGNDIFAGGFGVDTILGLAGNDIINGESGDDIIDGGAGNDTIWGGSGADSIDGGDGLDRVLYTTSTSGVNYNVVTGGTSGDAAGDTFVNIERFFGSNFDDEITGDADNDSIYGLGGADILTGNAGADLLLGGAGNDSLFGGSGADRLYGNADIDTIEGGADNDRIYGGTGADILRGDEGDDLILGEDGDDDILGGDGADTVFGGMGIDTIDGGAGDDFINGEAGNDILIGGGGNDTIFGADGDDDITGGLGNDIINTGTGTNTVDGGDGNDTVFAGNSTDTIDGGAGIDRVSYATSDLAVTVNLLTGDGGADATGDTYISIEHAYGSQFDDTITGDTLANNLYGLDGADEIRGGDGNDILVGGDGDDVLFGEVGNDRVVGGDGNDDLIGGAGNDRLTGGTGADFFAFADGHGTDRIYDFEDGVDIIAYSPDLSGFSDLTIVQSRANVVITSALGTIIINGVNVADITEADFDFAQGPIPVMPPPNGQGLADKLMSMQPTRSQAIQNDMPDADFGYVDAFDVMA